VSKNIVLAARTPLPTTTRDTAMPGTVSADLDRAVIEVEPGGWVAGAVAVAGPPESLLQRQAAIRGPAKVAEGPSLRAELPWTGSLEECMAAVRDALRDGRAVLAGRAAEVVADPGDVSAARRALEDYASSCAWPSSCEGERQLFRVDTEGFTQRIVAEIAGGRLGLRSRLVALQACEPVSRRALAHFLFAVNARLRLARACLNPDHVGLEVIVPARGVSAGLIARAFGALVIGATMARRECAALLEPAFAEAYCECHLGKETDEWTP